MRLPGKRALITGGTSGIGLSTVEVFAANGARVALTGRNPQTVYKLRERFGNEHLVIQSDAADPQAIDALCSQVNDKFGGLDILFANAGITGPDVSIENITEKLFDDVFDINVKGVLFLVQKALPLLADGASIILNASIAPGMGRRDALLYAASKSAVRTMARNISAELADRGIRCNAISPGPIDTPLWEKFAVEPEQLVAIKETRAKAIPTGRFGTSMEVAQAILFLASDESRYIVAADIVIDGGLSEIRR
jgi:NAD(P)-dependent dehydrogenase (short-subunit alcohol dehydrogenase family)